LHVWIGEDGYVRRLVAVAGEGEVRVDYRDVGADVDIEVPNPEDVLVAPPSSGGAG
jgi:hypothetical protein